MRRNSTQNPTRERRGRPRLPGSAGLSAALRIKGQMGQLSVQVLDFNRFGLAACCRRPLPQNQIVFLTLSDGERLLQRVIGVVHNCLSMDGGYRCGIRFRTQSPLQFDREEVESTLAALETDLLDRLGSAPPAAAAAAEEG